MISVTLLIDGETLSMNQEPPAVAVLYQELPKLNVVSVAGPQL